ncbi:MAG: linear amide C-N hydrolase [Parachlamydiales bacterium]
MAMLKVSAFVLLLFCGELFACTGLRLTATDKAVVTGRTVEFGRVLKMSTAVIPHHYTFTGKSSKGDGLVYTAKYAAVGVYCFDEQVLMDGINEEGLVAAAFYFPGYAEYGEITEENQDRSLSPVEFPNWILTQFASLDEVREAIPTVVIAPTVTAGWGPTPPPFHYVVYDRQGRSLVIEPLGGELVVYENPIGTITNSPTFDWHLTNLINYLNLSPKNAQPMTLRGVELTPFGMGSGMVGLPGDFTPPSRFVRAALFSSYATPSKNGPEAVNQTFHLLNNFDIPKGIAVGKGESDFTQLTSVKEADSKRYYFKTYGNQTIRYLDLMKFDLDAEEIVSGPTSGASSSGYLQSLTDDSDRILPQRAQRGTEGV